MGEDGFQIEFLFRDSKQFTGLLDCQARAAAALDFHCNASLATLNLVRAEDLGRQQGQEPHVFSMASWKQWQFNERLLDLFMENLVPLAVITPRVLSAARSQISPSVLFSCRSTVSVSDAD